MYHTRPSDETPATNPRAFLEHFAPHRRAGVANLFHYAVRGGARTPQAVLEAVKAQAARYRTRPDPLAQAHFQAVLEALQTDAAGALRYAGAVLEYEQLPAQERQQVKAERALHYLTEAMRSRPVTDPQLAYLKAVHYQGPPPANRAEASQLIDRLQRGRERRGA